VPLGIQPEQIRNPLTAALALLLALSGHAPFWEAKTPQQWTDAELKELFTNSPWAQQAVDARGAGTAVYLASARPLREAELELARRQPPIDDDPDADEYRDFLRENRGRQIILAVVLPDPKALDDPAEVKHLEDECVLKVGQKKYLMTGHFPPTPSDRVLRLVFPRPAVTDGKSLVFNLYVPGIGSHYRSAVFSFKDLSYRGAPEM
jgi:hypothetical protein